MKINRRKFITLGSSVIATLSGLSLVTSTGCSGVKRGDLEDDNAYKHLKEKLGDDRVTILHMASLAPSPHNTQPWYVRIITKDRWIIGADQTRRMKATDPGNMRLMLALGAFIENMTQAADFLGYDMGITVMTNDFFADDVAEVTIKKTNSRPISLDNIKTRKTLKKNFLNIEIKKQDLEKLHESLEGHFFFFPRGTWHCDCIRDGAIKAFQAWLDSDEAQAEHVKLMRVSNAKAEKLRDGLTTEGMEIKGLIGFFLRTFFSDEDFAGEFMKKESMKFTQETAHEGAGYAIITGYGRSVAGMIETGRRFERMALIARELNIGIQPMTQMLEMKSGLEIIGSKHSKKIDPQMILRIGYVKDYPAPVSLRRPVHWFVRGV